ncbi:MAG: LysR family transcriptional regulator [Gemmataceae bacterium]
MRRRRGPSADVGPPRAADGCPAHPAASTRLPTAWHRRRWCPPRKLTTTRIASILTCGDNVDDGFVQLPHLETFSKAAELSSFTGAAKALGLTQAAVSQRIQTLERSLGKSLFDRKGGRVLLTEAGQKLYAYAQRIIDLHREARRDITGREASVAGELKIAASSIPGEHLLPALLSVFGQKYPHVRVRAAVSDSMAVMGQVERGEVSVGLVGRKADGPNFEFKYLTSDRMVLVAARHTLTKFKQITVGQLAAHPLVLQEARSGLRHCFEKALDPRSGGPLMAAGRPRTRQQRGHQGGPLPGRRRGGPVRTRRPEGDQVRHTSRP